MRLTRSETAELLYREKSPGRCAMYTLLRIESPEQMGVEPLKPAAQVQQSTAQVLQPIAGPMQSIAIGPADDRSNPCNTPPVSKPIVQNQSLQNETPEVYPNFMCWIRAYPKRGDVAEALGEWLDAGLESEPVTPDGECLVEYTKRKSQTPAWLENGGQYIPNPAKFIRERRYHEPLPGRRQVTAQCTASGCTCAVSDGEYCQFHLDTPPEQHGAITARLLAHADKLAILDRLRQLRAPEFEDPAVFGVDDDLVDFMQRRKIGETPSGFIARMEREAVNLIRGSRNV